MILLFGGTSETAKIADLLAPLKVLVSTATDIKLNFGNQANVSRRYGRLDHSGTKEVISKNNIKIIVNAVHPYAHQAKVTSYEVAKQINIPHFTFVRPSAIKNDEKVKFVENHEQAAQVAFSKNKPVFVTTGSNNIEQYVRQSDKTGIPFVIRVLPDSVSVKKCLEAGVPSNMTITHRGKSSIEENRALIQKFNIGVIVTKDSGFAGGTLEKVEAAHLEKCDLIVLKRPDYKHMEAFESISKLVYAVKSIAT